MYLIIQNNIMIMNMNMNQDHVQYIVLVCCFLLVLLLLYKNRSYFTNKENFTVPPDEVLQNLSSLYNSQEMTASNILTGNITGMNDNLNLKGIVTANTINVNNINSPVITGILSRLKSLESPTSYVYLAMPNASTSILPTNPKTVVFTVNNTAQSLNSLLEPTIILGSTDFTLNSSKELVYSGLVDKNFNVQSSLTFRSDGTWFDMYLAKNGTKYTETHTSQRAGDLETNNYALSAIITVKPNDVIQVFGISPKSNWSRSIISYNMQMVQIK